MSIELTALYIFSLTLLLSILAQSAILFSTNGLAYLLGNRAGEPPSPSETLERANRMVRNTIEGAAIFVPLVLISSQLGISNDLISWGAIIFAGARIVYPIIFLMGISVARTLVWNIGIVGLVLYALGIYLG